MAKTQLKLDLGKRSYCIDIRDDWSAIASAIAPFIDHKQVLVVTNKSIAPLYLDQFVTDINACSDSYRLLETCILPDGEQYKTLTTLNIIFDVLIDKRFDRGAILIALGGGVVGDMVGFAAAIFQRGIQFIQVPTTLLSQVDSSVGGKTGVNHALGKNMIGAFYQPKSVLINIKVLDSLPEREFIAGLAEVIKYGLIYDAEFFVWLEENMEHLLARKADALIYAIERSCQIKADVVAQDEHEAGLRAILNLGHTYGHAIETVMGYGRYLHGEAVAIGLYLACDLSHRLGKIDSATLERASSLIKAAKLPVDVPVEMSSRDFLNAMAVDKKVQAGQLRLVLLKALGVAETTDAFDHSVLLQQLKEYCCET